MTLTNIPSGLWPHFQEYDVRTLDLDRDANLIIQRTLEYGTWDEVRWLFRTYGGPRIRTFVQERGERLLYSLRMKTDVLETLEFGGEQAL
jgi:hypothetical protein